MKATVNGNALTGNTMTLEIDDPFIIEEVLDRLEVRIHEAVNSYQYEFLLKYVQDFLTLSKAYEKMKDGITNPAK